MDTMRDFLDGFAYGADLARSEAEEQWGWYSRQLPDREREAIEAGGYMDGIREGLGFKECARRNA